MFGECAGPLLAQGGDALGKRFLEEAPRHWREYGDYLAGLQGKTSYKVVYEGKVNWASTSTIKQNANCKQVVRQFSETDSPEDSKAGYVWAYNPNYSFSLRRNTVDDPWALTAVEFSDGGKTSNSTIDKANGGTRLVGLLLTISSMELADFIKHPSFRMLQVSKVDHLGREAVRVEFDCKHPIGEGTFLPVQGGAMILDPSRLWCLREYDVIEEFSNAKKKVHVEMTYRDSKSNRPIPVRVVERREGMNTDLGRVTTGQTERDFDLEELAQLPEYKEFTLTAFGLPEPAGAPPVGQDGWRWYIWIGLAAFGSLGVAVALRLYRRRLQFSAAPKN
jgi:hypothetical protein